MSTDIDCESDLREPVRIKVIIECIRLGAQNGFADLARILRHFLYTSEIPLGLYCLSPSSSCKVTFYHNWEFRHMSWRNGLDLLLQSTMSNIIVVEGLSMLSRQGRGTLY